MNKKTDEVKEYLNKSRDENKLGLDSGKPKQGDIINVDENKEASISKNLTLDQITQLNSGITLVKNSGVKNSLAKKLEKLNSAHSKLTQARVRAM